MRRLGLLGLLSVACSTQGADGYSYPLALEPGQAVLMVNFVDQEQGPGIKDYNCGSTTYDGHAGTDLALQSFAEMDRGVAVIASQAGVVATVDDGHFDRSTQLIGGGFGNHVVLEHEDAYSTTYAHMKRGSILVSPGETVEQGQPLGLVGSSGYSNGPHLHIEFSRDGSIFDPYAGPCNANDSLWEDQEAYDDAFRVIDWGVSKTPLDMAIVLGPPVASASFEAGEAVNFWIYIANAQISELRIELIGPDGVRGHRSTGNIDRFYSANAWWGGTEINNLGAVGRWEARFYYDNSLVATAPFDVLSASASTHVSSSSLEHGAHVANTFGQGLWN